MRGLWRDGLADQTPAQPIDLSVSASLLRARRYAGSTLLNARQGLGITTDRARIWDWPDIPGLPEHRILPANSVRGRHQHGDSARRRVKSILGGLQHGRLGAGVRLI